MSAPLQGECTISFVYSIEGARSPFWYRSAVFLVLCYFEM